MAAKRITRVAPDASLRLHYVRAAIKKLREARGYLRAAGAPKAAAYVQRALKSAEGAERHAENAPQREARHAKARANA